MALNTTPPEFTVGIDPRGRLICQEENLEPSTVKELENFFLTVDAKFCQTFRLAANAVDFPISLGTITDAKVLFIYTQGNIEFKINSIGSAAIPCCPYALFMAQNAGIKELYLTNLGTEISVQVFVGA
jgi:hypothetical protein